MMRNRSTVKFQPGLFLQPFVVSQLVGSVIEDVTAGSGLAGSEFAVTSSINIYVSVTPTELARTLGMRPTTLSTMIERLVGRGQVRRVPNPDDGRSYLLELTAKGKATNAKIAVRFEQAITEVRSHLAGEPEDVLVAMRLLEDALRASLADH